MFDFKFDWRHDLDSGMKEIDMQHQQLFHIGRDMEQLLRIQCIGASDYQLLEIICRLRDFTSAHFAAEEEFMQEMDYPKLEKHRRQHAEYARYVMNINLIKLKTNPENELKHIKDEIQKWIFEHMLKEDKEFTEAYLQYQKSSMQKSRSKKEEEEVLEYVEGFGYKICQMDVSDVYLADTQSKKGYVIVGYREKVKDWIKLTVLERNTYFGELAKIEKAVKKLYDVPYFDVLSKGGNHSKFCFHLIPVYDKEEIRNENVSEEKISKEEALILIKEIRKALNK